MPQIKRRYIELLNGSNIKTAFVEYIESHPKSSEIKAAVSGMLQAIETRHPLAIEASLKLSNQFFWAGVQFALTHPQNVKFVDV